MSKHTVPTLTFPLSLKRIHEDDDFMSDTSPTEEDPESGYDTDKLLSDSDEERGDIIPFECTSGIPFFQGFNSPSNRRIARMPRIRKRHFHGSSEQLSPRFPSRLEPGAPLGTIFRSESSDGLRVAVAQLQIPVQAPMEVPLRNRSNSTHSRTTQFSPRRSGTPVRRMLANGANTARTVASSSTFMPHPPLNLRSRSMLEVNPPSPFGDIPTPCFDALTNPSKSPFQNQENEDHENAARSSDTPTVELRPLSLSMSSIRRTISDLTPGHAWTQQTRPNSFSAFDQSRPNSFSAFDSSYPQIVPLENRRNEFESISRPTLVNLMQGFYSDHFKKVFIIDCRYKYEYDGGHINGAMNVIPSQMTSKLTELFIKKPMAEQVAIVFHCEFSSRRGPAMCTALRLLDRKANVYPRLFYPYVFVMQGGYCKFFEEYPMFCGGYVEMKDPKFINELSANRSMDQNIKCRSQSSGSIRPLPLATDLASRPL